MKPIIGETNYKDMTPEDIQHFLYEAKIVRSAAIRDFFKALGRLIAGLIKLPAKKTKATKVSIARSEMVGAQ